MLNLDTHVLLFAVTGALRPGEQRVLSADQWSVSAIVLWEASYLRGLNRFGSSRSWSSQRHVAQSCAPLPPTA